MKSSFSVFIASGTGLGLLENNRNTASLAVPFLNTEETLGNPIMQELSGLKNLFPTGGTNILVRNLEMDIHKDEAHFLCA